MYRNPHTIYICLYVCVCEGCVYFLMKTNLETLIHHKIVQKKTFIFHYTLRFVQKPTMTFERQ